LAFLLGIESTCDIRSQHCMALGFAPLHLPLTASKTSRDCQRLHPAFLCAVFPGDHHGPTQPPGATLYGCYRLTCHFHRWWPTACESEDVEVLSGRSLKVSRYTPPSHGLQRMRRPPSDDADPNRLPGSTLFGYPWHYRQPTIASPRGLALEQHRSSLLLPANDEIPWLPRSLYT